MAVAYVSVNYRYTMERDERGEATETLDWWYLIDPDNPEREFELADVFEVADSADVLAVTSNTDDATNACAAT